VIERQREKERVCVCVCVCARARDLGGSVYHVPLRRRVGGADDVFLAFFLSQVALRRFLRFSVAALASIPLAASQTPGASLLLLCLHKHPNTHNN
jgi:hypothetical protein